MQLHGIDVIVAGPEGIKTAIWTKATAAEPKLALKPMLLVIWKFEMSSTKIDSGATSPCEKSAVSAAQGGWHNRLYNITIKFVGDLPQ
jgi:hypothetical protein